MSNTTITKVSNDVFESKVPKKITRPTVEFTPEQNEARKTAPLFDETDIRTERDNARDEFIFTTSLDPLVNDHFENLQKKPYSKIQPSFDETDRITENDNAKDELVFTTSMGSLINSHFDSLKK